jgi:hypothetical protein
MPRTPKAFDWPKIAKGIAQVCYESPLPDRAGMFPLFFAEGPEILVVFDLAPYQAGPEYRERELCRIRQRLDQEGVRQSACVTWPPKGRKDAGFCVVTLLADWSPGMHRKVLAISREEYERTVQEIGERS